MYNPCHIPLPPPTPQVGQFMSAKVEEVSLTENHLEEVSSLPREHEAFDRQWKPFKLDPLK